jgi:glutaredoxin
MRTGTRLLLILFCALVPALAAAGVYKWVDKDGKTQFSDQPPPDVAAEEVKIRSYTGPVEVTAEGEDHGARSVTLLTTVWCGVCKRAKKFLDEKGIAYTEYDVEKNTFGKAEYKRLNGKGVPIIQVGNQRMNGFSAGRLEKMLKNVGY